eukprot:COSAG03_NODE_8465_length_800_cov_1.252496_2_plen_79_part_01
MQNLYVNIYVHIAYIYIFTYIVRARYPWPDVTNVNPRPIYTIPLPPHEQLQASFALLAHVSLAGLLLGKLPVALRSLPS